MDTRDSSTEGRTTMTRRERDDLARVVRMRAKVAKADLDTLAKDRCADIERQLSAIHKADDADWVAATAEAQTQVEAANSAIALVCEARHMRPEFRPRLSLGWMGVARTALPNVGPNSANWRTRASRQIAKRATNWSTHGQPTKRRS